MSRKICIITQSHLCRNPRVLKEATALAAAGYNVQILTGSVSADLYAQDLSAIANFPNIRLQLVSDLSKTNSRSIADRFLNKLGRWVIRRFKIENGLALGYGALRYYDAACAIKADLYICHQELPTCIGGRLLKGGFKVAFDLEDWYSEDLLPEARAERPIGLLRRAESEALNKGTFCITTSNILAEKLAQQYSSPKPRVIYNVFPVPEISFQKTKLFSKPLKLFWFSQTIGPGRGLEQFIKVLYLLKTPVELQLLGNVTEAYRQSLIALLPSQHHLFFHDLVPENQLATKIAEFDIGLALELKTPASRNYTITNKFFQYIQSGLPVITSETEGQKEGYDLFKPGFKLSQQPNNTELEALEKWLNSPEKLQLARNRAIEAGTFYNWENESKKLISLVATALEK
ncbi:glycosyltransferase family 4 protein [Mucilaginibacter rubeus]|uniref:Glycosyltransferase family 4 protein n=1 Tax=Mucilaginibacter rubeus TaxID=2027860 RepID=A0A5C1I085_9SPHI|nr:glycosyltransferase family 4 protein [Mucilaginibacter rubeus]QEM11426.1 glycosyltransferase family 4 protein [Mucilaginibacter rubeus]